MKIEPDPPFLDSDTGSVYLVIQDKEQTLLVFDLGFGRSFELRESFVRELCWEGELFMDCCRCSSARDDERSPSGPPHSYA